MRIAYHFARIAVFSLVFLLGGWMAKESTPWSAAIASRFGSRRAMRGFFAYGGRMMEVVAAVVVFLDAVAVLVLATAW